MERPDASLVVPMYNEQENVSPLCDAVRGALEGWDHSWELVLVDDGSSDDTLRLLQQEAAADPRIRALALKRNSGQTLAMAAGFRHANGDVVVSMDGDLQNDPRDIPMLVERLESGYDVVCGWRKNRQDTFINRTLPSKIANKLIAWMTGVPIHDNGCSLKAYRSEVIRSLNLYSEMHRFLPALSAMTGARIDEVVVRHHPRVRGTSKYGIMRTFRVLSDMVAIKMVTQFGSRPGLWFGLLSLPWLVLGLLSIGVWLLGLWVLDFEVTIIFPSLGMMFLYLFGHMLSMWILSEIFLTHADREYLKRLSRVLTTAGRDPQGERPGRSAP